MARRGLSVARVRDHEWTAADRLRRWRRPASADGSRSPARAAEATPRSRPACSSASSATTTRARATRSWASAGPPAGRSARCWPGTASLTDDAAPRASCSTRSGRDNSATTPYEQLLNAWTLWAGALQDVVAMPAVSPYDNPFAAAAPAELPAAAHAPRRLRRAAGRGGRPPDAPRRRGRRPDR